MTCTHSWLPFSTTHVCGKCGTAVMTEPSTDASISSVCGHCGVIHPSPMQCPWIRAIEYHDNGTLKRIEYHATHFNSGDG